MTDRGLKTNLESVQCIVLQVHHHAQWQQCVHAQLPGHSPHQGGQSKMAGDPVQHRPPPVLANQPQQRGAALDLYCCRIQTGLVELGGFQDSGILSMNATRCDFVNIKRQWSDKKRRMADALTTGPKVDVLTSVSVGRRSSPWPRNSSDSREKIFTSSASSVPPVHNLRCEKCI